MVARSKPSRVVLIVASVLLSAQWLKAQVSSSGSRPTRPQKHATAVRIPNGAIKLDGRPDEAVWTEIPSLSDFVQKDPVEGAAPTDQLDVRLAYDDEALYVATRVRSKDPSRIQAPMSR